MGETSYAQVTVGAFLDSVAAREPTPSAGAVVALSMASAAGLVAMAARFTSDPERNGLAGPADALRARLVRLADSDASAYTEVLACARLPREEPAQAYRRTEALHTALVAATEVPLAIATHGVEVVALATRLTEAGNPNLAGDARAAAVLAEAGVRAAAGLVRANVRYGRLDEALGEAAEERVRAAADRLGPG